MRGSNASIMEDPSAQEWIDSFGKYVARPQVSSFADLDSEDEVHTEADLLGQLAAATMQKIFEEWPAVTQSICTGKDSLDLRVHLGVSAQNTKDMTMLAARSGKSLADVDGVLAAELQAEEEAEHPPGGGRRRQSARMVLDDDEDDVHHAKAASYELDDEGHDDDDELISSRKAAMDQHRLEAMMPHLTMTCKEYLINHGQKSFNLLSNLFQASLDRGVSTPAAYSIFLHLVHLSAAVFEDSKLHGSVVGVVCRLRHLYEKDVRKLFYDTLHTTKVVMEWDDIKVVLPFLSIVVNGSFCPAKGALDLRNVKLPPSKPKEPAQVEVNDDDKSKKRKHEEEEEEELDGKCLPRGYGKNMDRAANRLMLLVLKPLLAVFITKEEKEKVYAQVELESLGAALEASKDAAARSSSLTNAMAPPAPRRKKTVEGICYKAFTHAICKWIRQNNSQCADLSIPDIWRKHGGATLYVGLIDLLSNADACKKTIEVVVKEHVRTAADQHRFLKELYFPVIKPKTVKKKKEDVEAEKAKAKEDVTALVSEVCHVLLLFLVCFGMALFISSFGMANPHTTGHTSCEEPGSSITFCYYRWIQQPGDSCLGST